MGKNGKKENLVETNVEKINTEVEKSEEQSEEIGTEVETNVEEQSEEINTENKITKKDEWFIFFSLFKYERNVRF